MFQKVGTSWASPVQAGLQQTSEIMPETLGLEGEDEGGQVQGHAGPRRPPLGCASSS